MASIDVDVDISIFDDEELIDEVVSRINYSKGKDKHVTRLKNIVDGLYCEFNPGLEEIIAERVYLVPYMKSVLLNRAAERYTLEQLEELLNIKYEETL